MPINRLKINPALMSCVIEGTVGGLSMTGIIPDVVGISRFAAASRDLSVIVGLHGKRSGNVTLNLSEGTALFLAGQLLQTDFKELDEVTVDAVCELGNMVAGQFHTRLHGTAWHVDGISLPAFIYGANYHIYHLKNILTVSVTFEIKEVPVVHMRDKFFTSTLSLIGG